ncbi:MAG: aminotransferase class IV [Gemmataceae bacterium]|nr:aminotransferase class IV [Gemmataceae bacterium]
MSGHPTNTSPSIAWKNGHWLPFDQAGPSLADAGWVHGATVVDLLRTVAGKPFLLDAHLDRFFHDCRHLAIEPRWDRGQVAATIHELLRRNQVSDHPHRAWCVVTLATPGPLAHYGSREPAGSTLIIHGYPLPRMRYAAWFTEGARLVPSTVPAALPGPVDCRLKHRSRLHWWLAEQQTARESPGALPVLLTAEGDVTETAVAHIACVTSRPGGDVLLLPPEETVLKGVSLNLALKLAETIGLPFERAPFGWRDLQGAKEVFLTGSAFGICGVSQVGQVGLPCPGPWTSRLQTAWADFSGEPVDASFR